jgi:hypothetical protein
MLWSVSAKDDADRESAAPDCGSPFELSARNEYEHRRHGKPHRCGGCRHPHRPRSRAAIEKAKSWWLERHTLEEIQAWPHI